MSYDDGYGAYATVVLDGNGYSVHGFEPGTRLQMAFSDQIVSSLAPEKGEDVLALCVANGRGNGSDAPCWLASSDDRTWVGLYGSSKWAGDLSYDKWTAMGQVAGEGSTDWQTFVLPAGLGEAAVLPAAGQAVMADRCRSKVISKAETRHSVGCGPLPEGQTVMSAIRIGVPCIPPLCRPCKIPHFEEPT